jgi:hypothetical protein
MPLARAWIVVEVVNGIGQAVWTLRQGGYTPGIVTAPVLFALAVFLAVQVRRIDSRSSAAA